MKEEEEEEVMVDNEVEALVTLFSGLLSSSRIEDVTNGLCVDVVSDLSVTSPSIVEFSCCCFFLFLLDSRLKEKWRQSQSQRQEKERQRVLITIKQ